MAKSHEGLRCVHCGAPVEDLFYRIGQDIRLRQCSCGKVADHHIEFEILLVFIEMQLLRPEVYRHVLFNRFSPAILSREAGRFLLLCLILDTYTRWSQFKSTDSKSGISHWLQDSEHADWAVLGVTLLETGTYLLSVSVVALLGSSTHSVFSKRSHLRVWEAILVSSFGKVYKLIAMVWGGSNGGQAMVIALAIFVAASNIMAVETVLDSNVRSAAIAVVLASVLRLGVASCFMPLLIPWWCSHSWCAEQCRWGQWVDSPGETRGIFQMMKSCDVQCWNVTTHISENSEESYLTLLAVQSSEGDDQSDLFKAITIILKR